MHGYDVPYSLISRFIKNANKRRRFFLSLTLFAPGYFSEIFVFKRVRLHFAELTNWNHRPEVSLPPSVPSPTWYLKILAIIPHNTLIGVRQGRGESSFLSGASACYYNREIQFNLEVYNGPAVFPSISVSIIIDDLYLSLFTLSCILLIP